MAPEALQEAIQHDEPRFMIYILKERSVSVNAPLFGYEPYCFLAATCLHAAAFLGSAKCVKMLLEKGANPQIMDAGGKTPLERASTAEVRTILQQTTRSDTCGYAGELLASPAAAVPHSIGLPQMSRQSTGSFRDTAMERILTLLKNPENYTTAPKDMAEKLAVATRRLGFFEREMDKEIAAVKAKSTESDPKSWTDAIKRNKQVHDAINCFLGFQQDSLIDPVTARDLVAIRKKLNAQIERIQQKLIEDRDNADASSGAAAAATPSNPQKRPRRD